MGAKTMRGGTLVRFEQFVRDVRLALPEAAACELVDAWERKYPSYHKQVLDTIRRLRRKRFNRGDAEIAEACR